MFSLFRRPFVAVITVLIISLILYAEVLRLPPPTPEVKPSSREQLVSPVASPLLLPSLPPRPSGQPSVEAATSGQLQSGTEPGAGTVLEPLGTNTGSQWVPFSLQAIMESTKISTFPDWVSGDDNLPFTIEAQRLITQHQFPPVCDCKKQKFYWWRMLNQGLGSDLHTLSYGLSVAMSGDRILDVRDKWLWAVNQTDPTIRHYFGPLTNCTCTGKKLKPNQKKTSPYKKPAQLPPNRSLIPSVFKSLFQQPHHHHQNDTTSPTAAVGGGSGGLDLTWWRSQTTRWFLRRVSTDLANNIKPKLTPLPRNCISLHVRRSDKTRCDDKASCRIREMKRVELQDYMQRAEQVRNNDPSVSTIFVSTEDDSVIRSLTSPSSEYGKQWKVVSVNEKRSDWSHYQTIDHFGPQHLVTCVSTLLSPFAKAKPPPTGYH
eukprot:TRINITY_DN52951_c0_g1_i2.p1 TRINITY_DN52951_c0_g1~~TRINITY_DN52951_c0_g1_i2.p1  ORF type:complete len:430 (+),score=13.59 TRINITY_DN52951_c0_g1_i2:51-1340(+)